MTIKIGINGFGRMGRLALRAGWGSPGLEFVHINEVSGGPATAAHLLAFDSVHGRWNREVASADAEVRVDLGEVRDPVAVVARRAVLGQQPACWTWRPGGRRRRRPRQGSRWEVARRVRRSLRAESVRRRSQRHDRRQRNRPEPATRRGEFAVASQLASSE